MMYYRIVHRNLYNLINQGYPNKFNNKANKENECLCELFREFFIFFFQSIKKLISNQNS